MGLEIKHRYTGAVLYTYEPTAEQQSSGLAMRAALEAAVRSGADLRGADLCGADLYGADLRGADLCGADLRVANLCVANLRGADLCGADLYGADLRGADLRVANLCVANLCVANLYGADLCVANLYGADLRSANLYGADLCGADLRRADLRGAGLCGSIKLISERPIVAIGPIGSRSDYFYGYITDHGLRLRAGCFFGTADEFLAKLEREHGDNKHGYEYRAALDFIRAHAETWTPETVIEGEAAEEVA